MCRPGDREIRIPAEPAEKLSLRDAQHRSARPDNRIAVIAIRKQGSLGENIAGTGPLKDDCAAVFLVPYQMDLAVLYDMERDDRLPQVEQVFGRPKRALSAG